MPAFVLSLALAGAGTAAGAVPTGASAVAVGEAGRAPPLHVLLAAIGDEQSVFDRFVADFARRLQDIEVATLTTASASGRIGHRLDSPQDVYAAIRGLRGGRPGSCLVYLTGHGTRVGLSLPLRAAGSASTASAAPPPERPYAALVPAALASALREGCGDAPTVVVLSACYSGVYLRPGVTGPDRIVLTAAAADRSSFGCGDDRTYTYYDGCFLSAFDAATTWRQLAAATQTCVARLEHRLPGVRPSRPQAVFGPRVRDLPLPLVRPRRVAHRYSG